MTVGSRDDGKVVVAVEDNSGVVLTVTMTPFVAERFAEQLLANALQARVLYTALNQVASDD
jgi:hypothetical protein